MGVGGFARSGGDVGLAAHAVELQQRHAEIAAGLKVFDNRRRAAFIAVGVKDDGRVEFEMTERRIGPGDARQFVAGVRRLLWRIAIGRIGYGDMTSLVENVTGMFQARLIDHDCAVADIKAGQERGLR